MTNTTEGDVELSYYYNILIRNWALALVIFLIIMGAAFIYTFTTPKIYQARSLVLVTTQDQTSYLLGSSAIAIPRVDMETEKAIVMSSSVLNPVYYALGISDFKLSVEALKDSSVIEIRVESESPITAMKIANQIADSYVNYTRESKRQAATEVNNFISEQIQLYKAELDQLNMQLLDYNVTNKTKLTAEQKVNYQSLQQSIAAKEKLYNYLLSRAEEVSIAAKEKSGNIKIIEYASFQRAPVKPNIPLNLALGFILAIIISLGIVFTKENLKNAQSYEKRKRY